MTLIDVDPDEAREVLRCESELRPIFTAFIISLVGGGGTETERQTDNETEDGE